MHQSLTTWENYKFQFAVSNRVRKTFSTGYPVSLDLTLVIFFSDFRSFSGVFSVILDLIPEFFWVILDLFPVVLRSYSTGFSVILDLIPVFFSVILDLFLLDCSNDLACFQCSRVILMFRLGRY